MLPDEKRLADLLHTGDQLTVKLSDAQIRQLLGHLDLLAKWNRHFNLTAVRDPADMMRQHLFDSLSVLPALDRMAGVANNTILDVGSGAGFPGLTIAATRPESTVICVDSVGKKIGFIRQVIAELGLHNASAEHARIEQLRPLAAGVITSRAFASLLDFTTLTRKHLAPQGVWMAMKGKVPDAEISELGPDINVFHVEQLVVPFLPSARCLVWMRPA